VVVSVRAPLLWLVSLAAALAPCPVAADVPQVNFQAEPRRGGVPLTVRFTDTSNDADGTLVAHRWDFGDGTTSTEANPTHTYASSGKFDVALSVTDDRGRSDQKTARGFITVDPPGLAAAVLPVSRSVTVGTPATAFVTITNTGAITATSVGIELTAAPALPLTLGFQTTVLATNQATGAPNVPVDILAGQSQTYVIALTPTAPLAPTEVSFNFSGTNTSSARPISGVNTLLLSASTEPTPDIVALVVTFDNNGIVDLPGATGVAAFAVATVNLGAPGIITASADTGSAGFPVALALCQTDPATGGCLAPATSRVTAGIAAGATPTFGVFVGASSPVPFDPATNRVFVRFTDADGAIRGATSVAVRTR
jgi:PKD repeat protein